MKKRIVISVFSLLMVVGLAGTFWGPAIAEAASAGWNSCPHGEVNDAYPGDCHDYVDTNNDAICDRSQSDPAADSTTEASDSSALPDSSAEAAVEEDSTPVVSPEQESTVDTDAAADSTATTVIDSSYYFIPVAVVFVVLYGLTWILSARRAIKGLTHRKIWNVVLLISAAVSALLGLVRILSIDFNTDISLPFNVLFWHVEFSIVLGVVALFHIGWHWRYFTKMLKTTPDRCS